MTKASDNAFPSVLVVETASGSLGSVAPGQQRLAIDPTSHLLYWKDSAAAIYTALSNPMTAANDLIIGGASGVPTRLATSASKQLTTDGSGVIGWRTTAGGAADLASASYQRTSGDYSTTSSTFTTVDNANMALTITTGARRCLVGLVGTAGMSAGTSDEVMFDIELDGARLGGDLGLWQVRASGNLDRGNASATYLTDALIAGSHTFKLMWRVFATGTAVLHGVTTDAESRFWVCEMYAA